jgi:hypothetical protein
MSDESKVVFLPQRVTRPKVTIESLRGRLGHFSVSDEALALWPDLVLLVMGQCIVLRAGRCDRGNTVYLALSEQFAQVTEAEQPPMYEWVYNKGRMCAKRLRPPEGRGA